MPQRNPVPTLKLLCIRQLAWPDNLTCNEMTREPILRRVSTGPKTLFSRRPSNFKKHLTKLSKIDGLGDAIVNAWIRISNYYGTSLEELKQMHTILNHCNISTLDFLHEGYSLRNGTEWFDFAGLLPLTIIPQAINPTSWTELLETLKKANSTSCIQHLFISFSLSSSNTKPTSMEDFRFMKSMTYFSQLTKLVVAGTIDDNFMKAVGESCRYLVFIDIRGCSDVTQYGVLWLLLKKVPDIHKLLAEHPTIPVTSYRALTYNLEYFDISNVTFPTNPSSPLNLSKIIQKICIKLRSTQILLFISPGGVNKFHSQICKLSIQDIKLKILAHVKCKCLEALVNFIQMIRDNFQLGLTQIELRAKDSKSGPECGILFLYKDKIIVHVILENLTIIIVTSYSASSFDFIPLETLVVATPFLRQIKAPLKGKLTHEQNLIDLQSVTSSLIYSLETLKSIVLFSFALEYVEIREIFISSTNGEQLTDFDLHEMMLNGPYHSLEVFRILFPNQVTLMTGMKEMVLNAPSLRLVGDLKYWENIPFNTLCKFLSNMSEHNFDFTVEYDGILYHTNTNCKEFE